VNVENELVHDVLDPFVQKLRVIHEWMMKPVEGLEQMGVNGIA